MIPSVGREWMKDVVNCFLIRDPKDMILSYTKVNSNLSMHLLGLEEQYELFEYVTKINGRAPPVVDSKDILLDPRRRSVCYVKKLVLFSLRKCLVGLKVCVIRTEYGQNIGMIMSLIQRVLIFTGKKMTMFQVNI